MHGTQTDTQFVTSLYQDLLIYLTVTPEQGGETFWINLLTQGTSRGDVASTIADLGEAKSHLAPTTAQVSTPRRAEVRDAIPRPQPLASGEFSTIRLRLLKIAVRIKETASRISLGFASNRPDAALFRGQVGTLSLRPT